MADLIKRGTSETDLVGTATFVGGRILDIPLQYAILTGSAGTALLRRFGQNVIQAGPSAVTGVSFLDNLNLSPHRLLLFCMAVGSAMKHVYWAVFIAREPMSPGAGATVGVYNALFNSINTLLFICEATSTARSIGEGPSSSVWPSAPLIVGTVFFIVGILTEAVSEAQRKQFKDDPANKGKLFTGGLFKLARHINYGSYSLWRFGFATASAGWTAGGLLASWFVLDFALRGIPILDLYCSKRYKGDWEAYKKQTPYKMFPYVY